MAAPTEVDIANARKYASHRLNLLYIKKMYESYPHITSWLTYTVKRANSKLDYYYPDKLKSRAIFVETSINQKLCEQKLSCNQYTGDQNNEGLCQIEQEASNYRIGEGKGGKGIGYDVHCQPSCYHLKDRKSPDDTKPQSFPLKYHNGECAIINPVLLNWMEFPYFRSKTIYEHRVNDLPTGFNRSIEPSPYTTAGIKYEYNEMYCDSFFDKFDADKKNCYTPWYEVIGNAIVGEYIIKLCKAAHRAQINGNWNDLPSKGNLPPVPALNPNEKFKFKDWYNDINPKFKCPEPEMELKENVLDNTSSEKKKVGKITQIEDLTKKAEISVEERRQKEAEISDRSKTSRKRRRRLADTPIVPATAKDPFVKLFMNFLKMFIDPNTYRDLGIFIGAEYLAKILRKIGVYMVKELAPKLFATLMEAKLMKNIFGDVMKGVIEHITTSLVSKMCFEFVAKIALLLNPITALVSWALELSMIMDIILSIADPLNLNKKYPEGYLENLTISSEFALQKQLNASKPVVKFEMLVQMLLTHEEIGEISLHSWKYVNEYLAALDVNSEGSQIVHDEEKDAHQVIMDYFKDNQEIMNKVHLYTEKDLDLYEYDHMRRMKLIDRVKRVFCFCGAGLITAVMLQFAVTAYIMIFLISVLIYIQYLAVGSEHITDIEYYFQWF